MKAYKQWCIVFLRRTIGSILVKKAATPWRVGKGPDQSCVDHCWRASTLESHGDLKIISLWSSWWYMTSSLLPIYMLLWFDCNHQGVPRVCVFRWSCLNVKHYFNCWMHVKIFWNSYSTASSKPNRIIIFLLRYI